MMCSCFTTLLNPSGILKMTHLCSGSPEALAVLDFLALSLKLVNSFSLCFIDHNCFPSVYTHTHTHTHMQLDFRYLS